MLRFEPQEQTSAEVASLRGVVPSSKVPARICPAFYIINFHLAGLSLVPGMLIELLPNDGMLVSNGEPLFTCGFIDHVGKDA